LGTVVAQILKLIEILWPLSSEKLNSSGVYWLIYSLIWKIYTKPKVSIFIIYDSFLYEMFERK